MHKNNHLNVRFDSIYVKADTNFIKFLTILQWLCIFPCFPACKFNNYIFSELLQFLIDTFSIILDLLPFFTENAKGFEIYFLLSFMQNTFLGTIL